MWLNHIVDGMNVRLKCEFWMFSNVRLTFVLLSVLNDWDSFSCQKSTWDCNAASDTQWHSGIIVKCCLSELGHNVKPKHNYAPAALRTDMTRLCWSGSWNWMKIPTIVNLRPIDLIQQGSASHDIQLSSDNSSDIQLQKSIASRSYHIKVTKGRNMKEQKYRNTKTDTLEI